MEITNVNVIRIEKEDSRLRGLATIIIDDEIAIHNIRIFDGDKGLFIAMPSRKTEEKKYIDIVHPITNEARNKINQVIIDKYNAKKKEKNDNENII